MGSYVKRPYEATAQEREISENKSDTPILYENLGKDTIKASASVRIIVGTKYVDIDETTTKDIKILGPNFQSNDGCFIISNDNKIMNIKEGNSNGE